MTFIMITSFGGNALAESDGLSPAEEEYASEEALAGTAEESPGEEALAGTAEEPSGEEIPPADPSAGADPSAEVAEPDYAEEPAVIAEPNYDDTSYDTEESVETAEEAYEELPDDIVYTEDPVEEDEAVVSEETTWQTFEAILLDAELYNSKKKPKEQLAELKKLWPWLFNSDTVPVPGPDPASTITNDGEDEESYDIGY